MNFALKDIWLHMRDLGLGALAHANRHAAYVAINGHRWSELSVLQAAHAAELLIKARIAEEHPLLIFEQLPKSTQVTGQELSPDDLFRQGRTVQWSDLPDRLWATTGLKIPNRQRYDNFGKLRNGLQHFAPTDSQDPGEEALRFIFDVVDPFINQCWELFAVDFDEDDEPYIYFIPTLVNHEITFLVSPSTAETFEDWDVDWSKTSDPYRGEMHKRVQNALNNKN